MSEQTKLSLAITALIGFLAILSVCLLSGCTYQQLMPDEFHAMLHVGHGETDASGSINRVEVGQDGDTDYIGGTVGFTWDIE